MPDFNVVGTLGVPSGTIGEQMTQQLGKPLRNVVESTIAAETFRITDDAGDGSPHGDLNATDFTTQTGTTFATITPQSVVNFIHKSILYSWVGPKSVTVGVGGGYLAINSDLLAQGTADHALLVNLDQIDQHPIAAVTGLVAQQQAQDDALQAHLDDDTPEAHDQYATEAAALATFTLAGYGGIIADAATAIPNLTSGWTTLTIWDEGALPVPRYIVQDFPNNGIRLSREGIFAISVKIALAHNEQNAGRIIKLRFWNATTAEPGTTEFVYGVGRNTAATNLIIPGALFPLPSEVIGDLMQIQIGGGDDFSSVTNLGSSFEASSVSEAQGLET